mmetsp:Transcript_41270/g.110310  ORF Transcript_41270/g.110310 Transcript_41270/m.110310 type:complete len:203 (-) Transcript_41270:89-697(-)
MFFCAFQELQADSKEPIRRCKRHCLLDGKRDGTQPQMLTTTSITRHRQLNGNALYNRLRRHILPLVHTIKLLLLPMLRRPAPRISLRMVILRASPPTASTIKSLQHPNRFDLQHMPLGFLNTPRIPLPHIRRPPTYQPQRCPQLHSLDQRTCLPAALTRETHSCHRTPPTTARGRGTSGARGGRPTRRWSSSTSTRPRSCAK